MANESNLVLDPVCGMMIEPKKAAATRTFEGKTFHFCALGCAKAFDANPGTYAHAQPGTHGH